LHDALLGGVVARIEVKRAQLGMHDVRASDAVRGHQRHREAEVPRSQADGRKGGITAHVVGVGDLGVFAPAFACDQPLRAARSYVARASDVNDFTRGNSLLGVFGFEISIDHFSEQFRTHFGAAATWMMSDVVQG